MQAARGASLNDSDHNDPPTPRDRRPLGLFATVALLAYLVDLGTKTLALNRLESGEPVQVLAINESLLQFDADKKPFVEVEVSEQKFEKRPVEVGLSDGVKIEVLKGIDEKVKIKRPATAGPEAPPGPPPGK